MCDFTDKDTKFPKCSCMLNGCSECTGVFVPDTELNGDEDVKLPFIHSFSSLQNIRSCCFHKQVSSDHGKSCPLCMNIKKVEKGKVTTRKSIVLKS